MTSLRQALAERPELVREHLGRLVTVAQESKFVALAGALWEDGLFLYVPSGVGIEQPILHRIASTSGAPSFFRSLVIGRGRQRRRVGRGLPVRRAAGESLGSGVVELVTGQAARLRYANLQEWNHRPGTSTA